jgi:Ca2+-binding RTX toxin-like protein
MSAATAAASTAPRPAGLGYTPVEKYDWQTDVPADALDAKDFPSIDAWLDACIAQDRPGKIGSGTYEVDGLPRYAPKGIYGYGETPPKFVAENTDCWLYLKDEAVTLKGLQFEGFGQVLGGVVELSDGFPHHSTTKYAFDRFLTPEQGGTALEMQVKASATTVAPDVNISDCTFVNCENAFTFVSDTTQAGRIDFNNNVLTGTYGMLDVDSLYWTEVNASGNEWANCIGDRVQPNVKQNGVQTGFKIGVDTSVQMDGHTTKLSIVNNFAHDIQSVGTYLDTNAAVFVDVRGAVADNRGDNVISFNQIERLQGLKGQEDSNAIYAKAWGLVIEGNVIKESGAAYVNADHNGSEATGILVKPLFEGVARDIEVIANTFIDMPGIPAGVWPDLAVIKISEAIGNSVVNFNKFIGGGNWSGSSANGIVRLYGDFENLEVIGNSFQDVKLGTGDNVIVFHQLQTRGAGEIEVSNNSVSKVGGAFGADTRLVYFSGDKPTVLVTGHNTLEGGYTLLLSRPGTGDAEIQVYVPPIVSVPVGTEGSWAYSAVPTRVITGSGGNDTLYGGAGADLIDGGDRLDVMIGGGGDDTYIVSGYKDQIVETTKGGIDTVIVRDDRYFLPAEVENLVATKPGSLLVGNNLTNILTGTNGDDKFIGGGASDLINLGAGADLVIVAPGDGNDVVTGFSVNDRLSIAASAFSSFAEVKAALQQVGEDTILKLADGGSVRLKGVRAADLTAAQFDLAEIGKAAVKSTLVWQNTRGGTAASELVAGTSGNDCIDGKGGADVMIGGQGNDVYLVDNTSDRIIETSSQGLDAVLLRAPSYAMDAYVENVIVKISDGAVVRGNQLANHIEGGIGSDTLKGGVGADVMLGQDGGDVIVGGRGADILTGGAARDTYLYSEIGDIGDVITDFQKGQDHIDLSALIDQMSGSVFTKAVAGGLGVYLHHDGTSALVVTLKGVSGLSAGDLTV